MLDKYLDSQELFVKQIKNSINNNKINHAYLIDTNNYNDSYNIILAMIKEIYRHYCSDNCKYENIINLIKNNSFDNLIIINQDSTQIKKEQVLDIQNKFSTKSLDNLPRIYIIFNCENLNKYAANSLLKFLEEPNDNIIAILTTSNVNSVIDTIKSRCQLLRLFNINNNNYDNLEDTIVFIKNIEKYKLEFIAYINTIVDSNISNKNYYIDIFTTMINIYENSLRKIINSDYNDFGDILDIIIENNNIDKIIIKLNVLFETLNNLNYNLNVSIMLDKFIIDFNGGIND